MLAVCIVRTDSLFRFMIDCLLRICIPAAIPTLDAVCGERIRKAANRIKGKLALSHRYNLYVSERPRKDMKRYKIGHPVRADDAGTNAERRGWGYLRREASFNRSGRLSIRAFISTQTIQRNCMIGCSRPVVPFVLAPLLSSL